MNKLKISLLLVFLSNAIFSQLFTYTELTNLDEVYFTESVKELLLNKGFFFVRKDWLDKGRKELYELPMGKGRDPIHAYYGNIDGKQVFEVSFHYNSRNNYKYLTEKIQKYCTEKKEDYRSCYYTKDRKFKIYFGEDFTSSLFGSTELCIEIQRYYGGTK